MGGLGQTVPDRNTFQLWRQRVLPALEEEAELVADSLGDLGLSGKVNNPHWSTPEAGASPGAWVHACI